VKGAFSKRGMSPNMVDKFKPLVTNCASEFGGLQVNSLLESALK
jgi:hypothetical protein